MAKFDIDDILNELGVSADIAAAPPASPRPAPHPPKKKHTVDQAEAAFSTVPTAPSGQRTRSPALSPSAAINDVYQPDSTDTLSATSDLSQVVLRLGAATEQQLVQARQVIASAPGKRLADALIEQGADESKVQQAVAAHARLPFERVDLDKGLDGGFDGTLLQRLSTEFCRTHLVLPLRAEGSRVILGVARPDDLIHMVDDARKRLGGAGIRPVVVSAYDIRAAIEIVGGSKEEEKVDIGAILSEVDEGDVQVEKSAQPEVDLEKEASESPVVKYVNYIIQTAAKEGASDIHVEPAEKRLKVRFRIDGELYEAMTPPAAMSAAITSRLKIMANLDISERRVPQDGRIRCTVSGRKLDLRVSTLPTPYGEKTVMRILDTRSINVKLEELGFDPDCLELWRRAIDAPHGIVLVTGPTGSGKTTTLYASLRTLDKTAMNVSTVEDPIEYHLDGITQTQTHEKIGMTFAKALKALLRQDPDVIMLGEIRDHETAHIAVQAALTGHLVLSTLHTNDAPSSLTRLVNIGLEPFLVGAAVNAVLAQRLVRKLCVHCKSEEAPTDDLAEFLTMQGLDATKVWRPKGCDKCRKTGYSGRVGIYELLVVDDQLRDVIARNPNVAEFRRLCLERGMVTLRADGIRKVAKGQTSVEEVMRSTESTI